MNKKILISIFILLSILIAATLSYQKNKATFPNYSLECYPKAMEIATKFSKYVYEKYGFETIGTGGGFLENFNNLTLQFTKTEGTSIKELRNVAIESSQELLKRINSFPELFPYFVDNCFNIKNLSLSFSSNQPNSDLKFYYFSVSIENGCLSYYYSEDSNNPLKLLHQESYQTALAIYNKTHPSSPITPFESIPIENHIYPSDKPEPTRSRYKSCNSERFY